MAFSTNSHIDIDSFAHKLESVFPTGRGFGTGFIVDYQKQFWLFTCWHNIELPTPGELDMTGNVTATTISLIGPKAIQLDLSNRRIVGARVNGAHADIVAIELKDDEKPDPPYFNAQKDMWIENVPFWKDFTLGGHSGGEGIRIPILRHYIWQGFPGYDTLAAPESHRAVDFPGSKSLYPWMLRYTPGGYPGVSGGPIIELHEETMVMRVAGVHVHHSRATLSFSGISTLDNTPLKASAEFEWGAAVPVEILYDAIDQAAPIGISIADVSVNIENC